MAFVQAMNQIKKGVNGADVNTTTNDERVDLFTMLTRGLEPSYMEKCIQAIYQSCDMERIQDLWVMVFQTRDIRGGKGERQLFYQLLTILAEVDMAMTEKVLALIPEYGCWRDLWEIHSRVRSLRYPILDLVKKEYLKNVAHYRLDQPSKMNLLPKWLPREKSKTYPGLARAIACHVYPEESVRKALIVYRLMCSAMNRDLKTVEIDMCGKSWKRITPEKVPGRCLKNCDKAFLNEKMESSGDDPELRFPDDEDRMECRAHFKEFLEDIKAGKKKAHGANVVMPHELVVKTDSHGISVDQQDLIQAQWDSIREETAKAGGLGKCVPMCDFSGSMSGTPMEVSKALGILISEVNHPLFKDHILTFDSTPTWHSFAKLKTLKQKLKSMNRVGQGTSTDFYKACRLILDRMVLRNVPVGEEPEDLIVITDMGFDQAMNPYGHTSTWETQLTRIRREFQLAGEGLYGAGKGWKAPRIVIWNVRAEFKDFHATADQEGVVQLSGWSPSILKALQKGGVQVQTPYDGMRQILDDTRYDPVRELFRSITDVRA
jgi:hypothetical protein